MGVHFGKISSVHPSLVMLLHVVLLPLLQMILDYIKLLTSEKQKIMEANRLKPLFVSYSMPLPLTRLPLLLSNPLGLCLSLCGYENETHAIKRHPGLRPLFRSLISAAAASGSAAQTTTTEN